MFIPEELYIVEGAVVQTDNAGITTDIIELKNVQMCWILVHSIIAGAHATVYTPNRGTDVTTCATVLANAIPIWYCNPSVTNSLWVRKTDAVNYTGPAGSTSEMFLFKIDPRSLTDGYHTVKLVVTASGVANLTSIVFLLQPRYDSKPSSRVATEFIA